MSKGLSIRLFGNLFANKEGFLHRFFLMIGWTSFSQIFLLLGIPFISRLYVPEIYGLYAIYNAIMYMLNGVVALRCDVLITLPKQEDEAHTVLSLAIINVFLVSFIISLALWWGAAYFVSAFNITGLLPYLYLIPVGGVLVGLRNCVMYWAVREGCFADVGVAKFIQAPIMVLVQIIYGIFFAHIIGLILGVLVSYVCALIYLLIRLTRQGKLKAFTFKMSQMLGVLKKDKSFLANSTLSTLLLLLSTYMPTLLMAAVYGPKVAAWYALVTQAFSPLDLISLSLNQLYFNEGSRLLRDGASKLRRFYLRMMTGVFLLALIPVGLVAAFGAPLFSFVFGANWHHAGVYAQVLSLMLLIRFVVMSASQNLVVLKKQGLALWWSIVFVVLILLSFLPAYWLHTKPSPIFTLVTLSIGMIIAYGLLVWLNFYAISKSKRNAVPNHNGGQSC